MRPVLAFAACLILAGLECGCAQPPPMNLVQVTGKVTMNGKPICPGSIYFQPEQENGLLSSSLLQLDGSFTMRTYPHGDGVRPGTYKAYLQLGGGATPEITKFTNPATSPILLEVPAGGLMGQTLELSSFTKDAGAKGADAAAGKKS